MAELEKVRRVVVRETPGRPDRIPARPRRDRRPERRRPGAGVPKVLRADRDRPDQARRHGQGRRVVAIAPSWACRSGSSGSAKGKRTWPSSRPGNSWRPCFVTGAADVALMEMAHGLAEKARGRTSPNPLVGAVVVRDGEVVGHGYHEEPGKPHAEILALGMDGRRAKGSDALPDPRAVRPLGPDCALRRHRRRRRASARRRLRRRPESARQRQRHPPARGGRDRRLRGPRGEERRAQRGPRQIHRPQGTLRHPQSGPDLDGRSPAGRARRNGPPRRRRAITSISSAASRTRSSSASTRLSPTIRS